MIKDPATLALKALSPGLFGLTTYSIQGLSQIPSSLTSAFPGILSSTVSISDTFGEELLSITGILLGRNVGKGAGTTYAADGLKSLILNS